jgi:hypothetical protein
MLVINNGLSIKILTLFVFLIIIYGGNNVYCQPINDKDKILLEEAKNLNQSAQELLDKANALFSEIAILEKNPTKQSKKIAKRNDKAIDYQIKAFEQQKEANIITYQIYNKYINQAKNKSHTETSSTVKANLLVEQAEQFFYQAEMLRIDAYAIMDEQKTEKRDKLKEAQEHERLGLEKQYEAYRIFYDLGQEENLTTLVTKPGDTNVVINESLLNEYLKYLARTNETTTLEKIRNIAFSDSVTSENIRKQWDDYLYNYEKPIAQYRNNDTPPVSIEENEFVATSKDDSLLETSEPVKETISGQTESTIYKVQIAADKKPVSQGTLQKIYSSDKKVEVSEKDGWFNYSIGNFDSFAQAEAFKNTLGVENAFVVTIKDVDEPRTDKPLVIDIDKRAPNKTETGFQFRVQIAASKTILSYQKLKSIYSGSKKINQYTEDGWYKYAIGKFSNYNEAKTLMQQCGVKDAFIVSSYNGEKVPLYLAKRGIKPTKEKPAPSQEKIIFKVQIAADTKPLSSSKLHQIYSGYHSIESFTEDGWYKYSIGELNTFDQANKLRKECNVKGAFIIAFKNGKKINVLEAKKIAKDCYTPKIINDWQKDNNQILFRVQVAASKIELTPSQLKQKFCDEKYIYVSYENPWYKYAVGNFSNYKDANRMKERINVPGAFVVAYQYGEKLDIKQAINKIQ